MRDIKVLKAQNQYHYALCIAIRYNVFVMEQECPILEECTPQEDNCHHYVALEADDIPLGTARWREYDAKTAKVERVATMEAARGKGVASKLMMKVVEDIADTKKYEHIILGAQNEAIPFYEKLGYVVYGDEFMDAGIKHHMMGKTL
jgi:predicted GNAT family N-acyltransferase